MKRKHTKGKWEVIHSESKDAWNITGTLAGGKYKLARVPYITMERTDTNSSFNRTVRREAEADAKLMAAAPDLYAALLECEALIKDYPTIYRMTKEALNKTNQLN